MRRYVVRLVEHPKGHFQTTVPKKIMKNYIEHLKRNDRMLIFSHEMASNAIILIPQYIYDMSPYLRQKIREFFKEETI